MPPIGMLEAGGMVNKRTWPEHLMATVSMLLASTVEHKTEKGIDMPMLWENSSSGIVTQIDAEIVRRPTSLSRPQKCLRFELKQNVLPWLNVALEICSVCSQYQQD
jgi:hypothetical protein